MTPLFRVECVSGVCVCVREGAQYLTLASSSIEVSVHAEIPSAFYPDQCFHAAAREMWHSDSIKMGKLRHQSPPTALSADLHLLHIVIFLLTYYWYSSGLWVSTVNLKLSIWALTSSFTDFWLMNELDKSVLFCFFVFLTLLDLSTWTL